MKSPVGNVICGLPGGRGRGRSAALMHGIGVLFTVAMLLLFEILPATVGATTYTIKHFTQVRGASTFTDPFDSGGPPPQGPSGASSYFTEGTFLSADEHDGVLDLVTGRGFAEPGDDHREIGARVADSSFFFASGTAGSVEGLFSNFAPLPGEGYGIFIEAVSELVNDEAFLLVVNDGGSLLAVFEDEAATLGTASLTSFLTATGSGEIGLRLAMSASGVVTALLDRDGLVGATYGFENLFGSATTSLALGTDTHTGGFGAGEPVPEPGTLLLLGSGLLGAAGYGWRRGRRQ